MKECTTETMLIVSCEHSLSIQSVASSSPTKMTGSARQEVSMSLTGLRKRVKKSVPLASNPVKKCTTETMRIVFCERSTNYQSIATSSSTEMTTGDQELSVSLPEITEIFTKSAATDKRKTSAMDKHTTSLEIEVTVSSDPEYSVALEKISGILYLDFHIQSLTYNYSIIYRHNLIDYKN